MEWDLVNTCLVPEGRHQGQVVSLSQAAIDLSQPQPVSQSQPGSHSQVQMLLVDSRYTQNDARYPQLEAQAVTQGEMREEGYWSTEDGSMVASQEPLSVARATRALQHAQMQMSQYGHADAATSFLGSEQQQEQRQRQPLQQQRQLQLQQQLLQIQQQGRLQSQQQNLQLQQQGPLHLQQQLRQLRHQHMQVQLQLEEQRQHQQQSHQQRQQQQLRAELQQQQQRWPSTQQHEQQLQQPQQPRTSPSSATAETAATAATAVGREAPDAPLCDLSSRPDAGFQVGAAQEGGPTGGSSSKLGGSGSRSGSASGNCGGRNRSTSGDVSAAGAGSGGASGAGSGSSAGTRSGRVLSIREQLAQQLSRDMDMLIPGRLQRGGSSRAASTAGKSASPAGRSVAVADRSGDTAGTVADGPRPADAASPGTTAGTRADTAGSRGDTAGTAGTLGNMGSRMKASGHMASFGDSAPGLVNHVGAGDLPFLENSSNFNGFWATGGASGGGAMLDGPGQLDGSLLPLTYTGRQGDLADFILAESEQYAALRSSQGSAALVQAPSSVTQGQLPTMGTQAQAAPTVTQRQAPPRVTQAQALGQGGLARVGEEGRRKGGAGEAEQELAAIEAALLRDLKRRAAQIQVAGATLAQGRAMPTVTQGQAGGGQAMRTVTEKHAGRKTPPVVAQVQALPAAEAGTDAALLRNLDLPVARNQALRAKTLHDEAALMSRLEGQSVRNQAGQRPSVRGQAVESAAVQSQSVHGQAVRGQAARSGSGSLSCSGHSAEVGEGARRIPQAHQPASERAEAGLAGDLLDELARMLAQGEYITGPYNTVQSGAVNTSGQHSRVQLSAQNMDSWVEDAGGKGMVRRPGLVESERQQLLEVEALARLYQGGASDNGAGNGSVEFREGSGGAQPRAASELGQQQLYMHLEALARLGEGVGGSPGEEEGLPAPFINASLQSLPINPTVPHNSFANMSASNPASLSSPSAAGLSPEEIALLAEAKRQGLQPALSLHGMPEDQSEPWDLPLDCPGTAPVKPVAPPGALAYLGETPTEHLSNSRGTPGASAGGPPAIPGAATGTAGPASQLAIHSRILQHWDSHLGISSGALRSPEGPFSGTPGMHSVPGDKGARELGHIHLVREGHRDAGTSGSGHNSSSQGTTPVPPNRTLSGPHSESRHSTPQGCGASSLLGGPYSESVPPASLQTAQKEASAAGRSIGWTNGEAQWQQSTLGARDPGWHAGGVPLAAGTGGSRGADGVPLVGPGRGSLLEGRQAGREGDRLLDEVKAAPSQLGNQLAVMLQQLQGQAADQQARPLLLGAADVGGEAAVEGESGPEIASGGLKRSALLLGAVQGLDTDPSSTLAPYRDSTVSLAFSNAQGLAGFGAPGADMFPRPQLKRRIDTHQAAGFLRGEAGVGRGYKGGTPGYTAGAITLDPVPLLQPPRPPPAAPESRVMFLKQRLLLTARALESGNMVRRAYSPVLYCTGLDCASRVLLCCAVL